MSTGCTVTDVAEAKTLIEVLPTVRPTAFLGVPMLWYKFKAGIEQAIDAEQGLTGMLARWAVRTGVAKVRQDIEGTSMSLPLRVRYGLARRLVLSRLPAKIGLDDCVAPITGAAPIAVEALEFLTAVGIPVCGRGRCRSPRCTARSTTPAPNGSARSAGRCTASRSASPRTVSCCCAARR
jgi:long-subunit acyl-CoA synthetase (AMP-forming)